MVSSPEEGELKYSREEDNAIIISDSTLKNILPTQIKNMTTWKKLCVDVSVTYQTKACIRNYYHCVRFFWKIKDQSCNAQNKRSDEMANILFDT